MQAARATAIERFPYLDVALTSMVIVEAAGLGTVATDARWRFYYDPQRVMAEPTRSRLQMLVSDWVHEVGHLLRDHAQRWTDLGQPPPLHRLFNMAGDALINHDLAELGLTLLPTDVTFDRLPPGAGAAHTMTTEEIYQRLRRAMKEPADLLPANAGAHSSSAASTAASDDAWDCGSCAGDSRRPWELPIDDSDGQPLPNDGSVDPGRGELVRHETAGKLRSHVRAQGTGSTPAALRAWADSILEPLVDWRRELRAAVSRGLSQAAGRRDYSWGQPARRRVPGYTMPGMVAPAPPSVAVVVDTSGSMSADDLAQCISDIAALTRSVSGTSSSTPVRVLPCDTDVGEVSGVRDRSDISGVTLTGGGGTDLRVGIHAAARLRPTPDVIVILTDGYTPWPTEAPAEAPRTRYVAVVVDDNDSGADIPEWMHAIGRDRG